MSLVRIALVAATVLTMGWSFPQSGSAKLSPADQIAMMTNAAAAYDKGQCDQVLQIYAQIASAAPQMLDGVAQYRLGFCTAAQRGNGTPHYEKAASMLDQQAGSESAPLEAHFYLVNSLLNLRRAPQAKAAAERAVTNWKAGKLVVSEKDPQAWFRLGKLFRDSGDGAGAVEPYSRAIAIVEKKQGTLRTAYLQRIADAAANVGNQQLVTRTNALMDPTQGAGLAGTMRDARVLLTQGKVDEAHKLYKATKPANANERMTLRYATAVMDRVSELKKWGKKPIDQWNGDKLSAVGNDALQTALRETNIEIAQVLTSGSFMEVPRKKFEGMRMEATPEVNAELQTLQAKMTGLLLEAVRRGAPIREWAVSGGFARPAYHSLPKLFRQSARQRQANGEMPTPQESSVE